jgi:hypothetical protein
MSATKFRILAEAASGFLGAARTIDLAAAVIQTSAPQSEKEG